MLSCGFYHRHETKSSTAYRHFNTFFGDPVRAQLTGIQNKIIKEDQLLESVEPVGAYLKNRLHEVEKKYPSLVNEVRGKGTFMAFTSETAEMRDALMLRMKYHGVNQGGCGTKSARFRPTLYFNESHADFYVNALEKACKDLA